MELAHGRQPGQWGGSHLQRRSHRGLTDLCSQQRPARNLVATGCTDHPPAGVDLSPSPIFWHHPSECVSCVHLCCKVACRLMHELAHDLVPKHEAVRGLSHATQDITSVLDLKASVGQPIAAAAACWPVVGPKPSSTPPHHRATSRTAAT